MQMGEMAVPFWKNDRITPAQIIILGFLLLITVGTVLLMLPFATNDPGGAPFLDALFTATSATCVTGLVVQDTALYWSPFGQAVILVLIQIGGMGVVTMAVAIFIFSGRRISLKQRWVMQESISAPQVGGIVRQTRFILKTAVLMEAAGAVLLALRFCPGMGWKGLWYAVFHSISAFCNAGFDLMGTNSGPCSSMTAYTADALVNIALILLIVLGGIGFMTWQDFREHKWHVRTMRLQTKVVLSTTAVLLVGGFLYFSFYEFRQTQWRELGAGERFWAALFQTVTPRTAGFNTVDLSEMTQPSQLVTVFLMLVGGSPGSTAGGFKTTTLAVLLLTTAAVFRRRDTAHCFGRRLQEEAVHSATALLVIYLLLAMTGGILICCIDGIPLMGALFESASAVATVGLSLGYTGGLSAVSRLILIFLMYFGRVGGLTVIYAVTTKGTGKVSQFPQERLTVG